MVTQASALVRRAPDGKPRALESESNTATPEDGPDSERRVKLQRLESLGRALSATLKEAIDGRSTSGIEIIWAEDEEHFEGIDDANRGFVTTTGTISKPPYQLPSADVTKQSIEFPNITRPYVEAAAAKVGDIFMPTDGSLPWKLTNTPIPDLIEQATGGLKPEVIEGLASINASEETTMQVLQAEQGHAQALIEEAKEKAKRASKRIEDWHIEGQWQAQVREVVDDSAKAGTGVIKGPVPTAKRKQMYRDGALIMEKEITPTSKRIDYWNCYPDPACGNNIQNGRYHWERDYLTPKQLFDLKQDPDYIGSQIDLCLEEGPQKKRETRKLADGRQLEDKDVFEVWYFYGFADRDDLEAANVPMKENMGPVLIPAMFTMVNDRVIKGSLNPLDTGEFPYDYLPWQRRKNSPWGFGVGRQIRTPQRIVVAATRVMLTNAGRAAGPMLVLRNKVKKSDGTTDITPWGVYYIPDSAQDQDAQKAAQLIEIPALTAELMQIIEFGLKLAEDVTGLPLLLQGQAGSAPETLGGQQLVDRNATGVLRRLARNIDDCLTEPHLRRYYAYLLLYGPDDMEKGEFVLDARGTTAMVDRELYKQETSQLLQASLNPQFKLDPAKTMAENLRANNRNPADFQYSDEDWAKVQASQAQQKPDPRAQATIEAAKIKVDGDTKARTETSKQTLAELQFKAVEAAKQRQHDKAMADIAFQQRLVEFAQEQRISLDDAKAKLSDTVIKVRAQMQLGREKNATTRDTKATPQVASPAVEPPGRAEPGRAFEQ
jgi:hypothetical protein